MNDVIDSSLGSFSSTGVNGPTGFTGANGVTDFTGSDSATSAVPGLVCPARSGRPGVRSPVSARP